MKFSDVVTEVRLLINDNEVPYRIPDTSMLVFCQNILRTAVIYRPDLFTIFEEIDTIPNSTIQEIPTDGVRIVDIYNVVGGDSVTEQEREIMENTNPKWRRDPAGPARNWIRHPRNARHYFIYPQAVNGQRLYAEYVGTDMPATLTDEFQLAEMYRSIIVYGVVFMCESIDDEHVNGNRAKMFYDLFTSMMNRDYETKQITDVDDSLEAGSRRTDK